MTSPNIDPGQLAARRNFYVRNLVAALVALLFLFLTYYYLFPLLLSDSAAVADAVYYFRLLNMLALLLSCVSSGLALWQSVSLTAQLRAYHRARRAATRSFLDDERRRGASISPELDRFFMEHIDARDLSRR